MAKISVAPKRARTKILLPLRVKRDPAYIELRLTHLRHEPPAARAGGAAGVGWNKEEDDGSKESRRPTKKQTVKKKPPKRKPAKKPRWTRVTGGDRAVPPKLADTDGQIQRLWHNISTQCVSIASSIDTTPSEMIPHEMRERWLRELRKTAVALALLVERLAGGPTAEA